MPEDRDQIAMETRLERFEKSVLDLQEKYAELSSRIDRIPKALTDGTAYREIMKEDGCKIETP